MYVNPSLEKINQFQDVDIPSPRKLFELYGFRKCVGIYSQVIAEQGAVGSSDCPIRELKQVDKTLREDFAEYKKQIETNK